MKKEVVYIHQIRVGPSWMDSIVLFLKEDILLISFGRPMTKSYTSTILEACHTSLVMSYEHIDACKNDCALFWKENKNLDKCPVCEAPRYKGTRAQGKKIPHKVLCYFLLTPRLRRLYMSGQSAKDMRWYIDKHVDDGIMRHPTNSEECKEFDLQHPDFAIEPHNVRLGLAIDGFNPFGNMNNNYSMWPIILIPCNLPPWLVIDRKSVV